MLYFFNKEKQRMIKVKKLKKKPIPFKPASSWVTLTWQPQQALGLSRSWWVLTQSNQQHQVSPISREPELPPPPPHQRGLLLHCSQLLWLYFCTEMVHLVSGWRRRGCPRNSKPFFTIYIGHLIKNTQIHSTHMQKWVRFYLLHTPEHSSAEHSPEALVHYVTHRSEQNLRKRCNFSFISATSYMYTCKFCTTNTTMKSHVFARGGSQSQHNGSSAMREKN